MAPKSGIWDNSAFLMELSVALYHFATKGGALDAEAKAAVETYLKAQGHDQSWESVR